MYGVANDAADDFSFAKDSFIATSLSGNNAGSVGYYTLVNGLGGDSDDAAIFPAEDNRDAPYDYLGATRWELLNGLRLVMAACYLCPNGNTVGRSPV